MNERGVKLGAADVPLWIATFALVAIGLAVVFDAGFVKGIVSFKDPQHFLRAYLIWAVVGAAGFAVFALWGHLFARRMAGFLMVLSVGLCGLALLEQVGVGPETAQRWIKIPGLGVRFQPSELAKLALILYLTAYFTSRRPGRRKPKTLLQHARPVIVPTVLVVALVVFVERGPDLGTAIILAAIALGCMFFGRAKFRWIAGWASLAVIVGVIAILHGADYRKGRISGWLHPFEHYDTTGYDPAQSLINIGSGQWTGMGFGKGRGKRFLSAATTDYVFVTVAEETGVFGSLIMIGMLGLVVWRCFAVSQACNKPFGAVAAAGVGWWIGAQSVLNLAMVANFAPSVGIPLPFLSYGGSSLCSLLCGLGLVQNVARMNNGMRVKSSETIDYGRRDGRAYDAGGQHRAAGA